MRILRHVASVLVVLAIGIGFTPALDYRVSWVGNTFGGRDGEREPVFVQMDARCLFVSPDGMCFLNVPWEEGGLQAGVYKDGQLLSVTGDTHGWGREGGYAVAANDTYVWIAQGRNNEGGGLKGKDIWPPKGKRWDGLTRRTRASLGTEGAPFAGGKGGMDGKKMLGACFLVVNETTQDSKNEKAPIRGLALDDAAGRLYVSNPHTSEIFVYDSETMQKLAAWPCEDTRQMAVDPEGKLWVVQAKLNQWGRLEENAPTARIVRFDANGVLLPQTVSTIEAPTGIAFTPDGRMLVADNGDDQQIKIFSDWSTAPKQTGTFGMQSGILAEPAGVVAPQKFNGPQGVGCDAAGNLYIAGNGRGGNGSGMTLECYAPTGERAWALHGLEFVDCGDFDRASDGEFVYTTYERFRMNYAKTAPGSEWSYDAFTLDWKRYPHDLRMHKGHDTAWIRQIGGKRFLFGTDMYSSQLTIHRFMGDSPVAIPCGVFVKGAKGWKEDFPPDKPEHRFLWIDRNGDGQITPDEYDADGEKDPPTWAWCVDARGDVWQGYQDCSAIVQFPCQGLNEHDVPQYSRATAVKHTLPAPFDDPKTGSKLERLLYEPATDVMYLTGYTPDRPNSGGAWKNCGRVLARYEAWSGERRKTYEIALQFGKKMSPASFATAGDLLFVVDGFSSEITIHDAETAAELDRMRPQPNVGHVGWVDIPYGMNAHQRKDGEYLVLVEEDARAKNLLYRFRAPTMDPPAAPSGLKAACRGGGKAALTWKPVDGAGSYVVRRAETADGPSSIVGHAFEPFFSESGLTNGREVFYAVTAVHWGGESPASGVVSVTPEGPIALVDEDFEDGTSRLGGIDIVSMPKPKLPDGGAKAGRPDTVCRLPGFAVPDGATKLVIAYNRLFLKNPSAGCKTHYTRQFVHFKDGKGRVGESNRFKLEPADAGKWTPIRLEIEIPAGITRITGGELNNIAEGAAKTYDNPVYIDNLRITAN